MNKSLLERSARRRAWVRRVLGLIILIGVGTTAIWGFLEGRDEQAAEAERDAPVKAPLRISTTGGETVITLNRQDQQSGGIQTAKLQATPNQAQVQAYGVVIDLQPLTDLSNSYTATKAQLQTAQAKLSASQLAFERAQRLYQNRQIISAADFQTAEAVFRTDEASVAASETQLQNIAASALQQWGKTLGDSLVDRAPMLLRLLQRQDVLLQVTLPPGDSLPAPPKAAVALSDNGIRASIQYVSPATRTDIRIQGVSFYYIADAGSGLLPGMNVVVMLPAGGASKGSLVPANAVVWSQGKAWAYFRTGDDTFVRREIATDTPTPDGGYVVKGLSDNAEVVVQGAQLLLSEEFRSQIEVGEEGPQ